MKKLTVICMILAMIFASIPSNVQALESDQIDSHKVVQIMAEDNILNIDGSYTVKDTELIGTALEGKSVVVKSDGVYINGARSISIEVIVAGSLIGYLIDGAIVYLTGYTGTQLATVAISAIVSFVAAHPLITITVVGLLLFTSSSVNSYRTSSGQYCVYQAQTKTYLCTYSGGI